MTKPQKTIHGMAGYNPLPMEAWIWIVIEVAHKRLLVNCLDLYRTLKLRKKAKLLLC